MCAALPVPEGHGRALGRAEEPAAAWNRLVRLLYGFPFRDVDCAFKLFPRELLQGLELSSSVAVFSTELLVRAFSDCCLLHIKGSAAASPLALVQCAPEYRQRVDEHFEASEQSDLELPHERPTIPPTEWACARRRSSEGIEPSNRRATTACRL